MIQFEPPYSGTDKRTNFPIIVFGVVGTNTSLHALVITAEGDLDEIPYDAVNVDWRWDAQKRAWLGIDTAAEED